MHTLVPLSAEDKLAIAALPYPVSAAEEKRVRMVRACNILDSGTDDAGYNSATHIAIRKLKMNQCSFNIIDINRSWLKSKQNITQTEVDRGYTVCTYVILDDSPDITVIPDLQQDERFNAWMPDTIRFYAGCAIVVEGFKIGALCVLDSVPHYDFDETKRSILKGIAGVISNMVAQFFHKEVTARCGRPEQLSMNIVYSLKQPLRIVEEMTAHLQRKYERVRATRDGSSPVGGMGKSYQQGLKQLQANLQELGTLIETSLNYAHTRQMERCTLLPHVNAVQDTLRRLLVLPAVVRELHWQCNDFPTGTSTLHLTYPYVLRQVLLCAVLNLSMMWDNVSVDMTLLGDWTGTSPTSRGRQCSTLEDSMKTVLAAAESGLHVTIAARDRKEVARRGAHRARNEYEVGLSVVADIVHSVGGTYSHRAHNSNASLPTIADFAGCEAQCQSDDGSPSCTHSDLKSAATTTPGSQTVIIYFPCAFVRA